MKVMAFFPTIHTTHMTFLDTHLGFLQENHLSCVLGKFLSTQLLRELGGCCELGTIFDYM
jgi:hypothetical protein